MSLPFKKVLTLNLMAWNLFGSNWLTGIICMWHGLLVDIPNGWALCDGNNGTPDLRGKFVRGSNDGIDPGGTGGIELHRHIVTGWVVWTNPAHTHQVTGLTGEPRAGDDDTIDDSGDIEEFDVHRHPVDITSASTNINHTHQINLYTTNHSNLPPYYDIAYIMKI